MSNSNQENFIKRVKIYTKKPLQTKIRFKTEPNKDKPQKRKFTPSLISNIANLITMTLSVVSLIYSYKALSISTETIKHTDIDRARQDTQFYLQNCPIIAVTYFRWTDFLSNNDQSAKISIHNFGNIPAQIISVKRAIFLSEKKPTASEIDTVISFEKEHPLNYYISKNDGIQDLNLYFDKEKKDIIINDLKRYNNKSLITVVRIKWFNELTSSNDYTTVLVGSTGTNFENSQVFLNK